MVTKHHLTTMCFSLEGKAIKTIERLHSVPGILATKHLLGRGGTFSFLNAKHTLPTRQHYLPTNRKD